MSFTGQSSSVSLSVIPIFEGEIYKFSKVKMETFLLSEGLWNIVKGFNKPADENQLSEAEKEKLEVNRMIMPTLSQSCKMESLPLFFQELLEPQQQSKLGRESLLREFQGNSKAITVKFQSLENLKI